MKDSDDDSTGSFKFKMPRFANSSIGEVVERSCQIELHYKLMDISKTIKRLEQEYDAPIKSACIIHILSQCDLSDADIDDVLEYLTWNEHNTHPYPC
jgi:hypothetical protein